MAVTVRYSRDAVIRWLSKIIILRASTIDFAGLLSAPLAASTSDKLEFPKKKLRNYCASIIYWCNFRSDPSNATAVRQRVLG